MIRPVKILVIIIVGWVILAGVVAMPAFLLLPTPEASFLVVGLLCIAGIFIPITLLVAIITSFWQHNPKTEEWQFKPTANHLWVSLGGISGLILTSLLPNNPSPILILPIGMIFGAMFGEGLTIVLFLIIGAYTGFRFFGLGGGWFFSGAGAIVGFIIIKAILQAYDNNVPIEKTPTHAPLTHLEWQFFLESLHQPNYAVDKLQIGEQDADYDEWLALTQDIEGDDDEIEEWLLNPKFETANYGRHPAGQKIREIKTSHFVIGTLCFMLFQLISFFFR